MGGDRSSPTPTARPTPTPGPGDLASTDVDTPGSTAVIHVDGLSFAGRPFETIAMRGRYAGAQSGTVLRVQALEEGQWVDFPLPTITDDAGRFTAHIELGSIGEHRVRIVDQHNDAASETVIVVIR
jgi:hypothetical protein